MPGGKYNYHSMLRALGAWLDEEDPPRFTVLETTEGFDAILDQGATEQKPEHVRFSYEALTEREKRLRSVRKHMRGPGGARHHSWKLADAGRQDLLRALGFELDDAEATNIIVDELDDQLLLTYSYVDPTEGYLWRKRLIPLGRAEMERIVEVARERRKKERKGLFRF